MTDLEKYKVLTGLECNIVSPVRHTEWLMWYKRNCRDPLLTLTADKIAVRDYVSDLGYGEILNEADAHYSIDGLRLPVPCVVKMNNASGRNRFVRNEADIREALRSVAEWLRTPYGADKEEWAYQNIRPGFLVERMLWGADEAHMMYRFLCWGGKIRAVEVHENAARNGRTRSGSHTAYSADWIPYEVSIDGRSVRYTDPPTTIDQMMEIAGVLSTGLRFARVDLYEYDGRVGFSEITHYPRSGKYRYDPIEFDEMFGSYWRDQ